MFTEFTLDCDDSRIFLLAWDGAGLVAATGLSAQGGTSKSAHTSSDVSVMQGALALEHEGIAAYRLAGGSGLLKTGTLKLAQLSKGHHGQHRDAFGGLISKAGGKPVQRKRASECTKELNLGALKSEGDLVVLATSSDEAVHWGTLNNASGKPIPAKAFLFG